MNENVIVLIIHLRQLSSSFLGFRGSLTLLSNYKIRMHALNLDLMKKEAQQF